MTRVNMVQVEFNEINNNINIYIIMFLYYLNNEYLKYIYNVTTFLNPKMMTPRKLV